MEVYGSCAATLEGEMYVLGGAEQPNQVNIQAVYLEVAVPRVVSRP